jgi:PAS domain S-box-containing protein
MRYAAALLAVGVGVASREVLTAMVGPGLPTYVTFYPVVMLVGLLGGLGPGLVATVVTAVVVDYWVLPPQGFRIERPVDAVGLGLFLVMGSFMSAVAEFLRRSREKAAAYDREAALRETRRRAQQQADEAAAALQESDARLAEFAAAAFEGIVISEQGRIVDCNPPFADLLGFTPAELKGRTIEEFVAPEDRPRVVANIMEGRESFVEHEMVRREGTRITVETHGRPSPLPGRRFRLTAVRDVTFRRRQEEVLRRLNRTLKALNDSSEAMLHATAEAEYLSQVCQNIVTDCGHAMAWIGFAENDAEKSVRPVASAGFEDGYLDTLHLTWADSERGRGPTGTAIRTARPCVCRDMLKDPAFAPWRAEAVKRGYASSLVVPLLSEGGAFGAVTIYSREPNPFSEEEVRLLAQLADDVAYCLQALRARRAQAQAEEILRRSERQLQVFIEHAPVALAMFDLQMRYLSVSRRWRSDYGLGERDLRGQLHYEVCPEVPQRWREVHRRGLAGEVVRADTDRFDRPDGSVLWLRWEVRPWHTPTGEVGGIILFTEDITARQQAEEQLRLLSTAVESAANGVAISDRTGRIRWVNPAFGRLTGYGREEVVGQDPRIFKSGQHSPEFYCQMWATILRGEPWHGELVNRRKDGSLYSEEMTITPVRAGGADVTHFVAIKQDITARKQAENALQSQMAALAAAKAELQRLNEELEERVVARTAELAESEVRYRSLVTASAQVVWITSPKGRILSELPAWQAFTGQTFDQYRNFGWLDALHPDERRGARSAWREAVRIRGIQEVEYRIKSHDGSYRDMLVRGVPVLQPDGSIREWVGTCTDITERKEADRRRGFTASLLELFVRKTSAHDYLNSVVGIIRQWSGAQALGIRLKSGQRELPYASWAGFAPEFLEVERRLCLEQDECLCMRAVSGGVDELDRPLLTRGGSFRADDALEFACQFAPEKLARYGGNCMKFGFTSLAVIPIRYREEVIGVLHLADRRRGQFPPATVDFIESITPLIGEALHRFQTEAELARHRDDLEALVRLRTAELAETNARLQVEILQRQRAQETLQETADELKRSNRDLEQFAYIASHDLQEPLRAVGGFVKLLQRRFPETVDAKALEYITGAADGAVRMERLITDLLTFSRVGTKSGSFVPTDLNAVLQNALRNLHTAIRASEARITADSLPTVPVDATQMLQLFQNLLANAIKFRGERPPEVHVAARSREGGWLISVRDNGIGIEAQYFDRIFQIFQRLHTRRHYPGTGIGLAICKKIVERHGGAIWVESEPGRGSTFNFTLLNVVSKLQTGV